MNGSRANCSLRSTRLALVPPTKGGRVTLSTIQFHGFPTKNGRSRQLHAVPTRMAVVIFLIAELSGAKSRFANHSTARRRSFRQRSFHKRCRNGRKSGILSYSGMQWCLNFQLPWQGSPQALKAEYLGNNSTAVLSCWQYDRRKGTNLAKRRSRVRTSDDRKLTRELRLWEATRMTRRSPWMPRKGL